MGTVDQICDYLGASRLVRVIAPLVSVIDSDEAALRCRAIEALAYHGSDEALAALEARANRENDPELVVKIREVLAQGRR